MPPPGVTQITDDLVPMCEAFPVNFEFLVRQHKDAIYGQMVRVCGNRRDVEDILIEALFKAYRSLDQLRDSAAFRAWLAAIAGRVCWQLRKREALLPILQLSAGNRANGRNALASVASLPSSL
jgi:DNA-directed RNA polymerase specialized sigma24 family protein